MSDLVDQEAGGALNRQGWAEVSQAALARQKEAEDLLRKFASNESTTNDWTVVIPADIHLVQKCYTDLRKVAGELNVSLKRQEITEDDKKELPTSKRRNGKMFVILGKKKNAKAKRKHDGASGSDEPKQKKKRGPKKKVEAAEEPADE